MTLSISPQRRNTGIVTLGLIALLAAILSFASIGALTWSTWLFFFLVSLLAAALVWAAWALLAAEEPHRWLGALVLGAIALRLALGVFWFHALPAWGYGGPVETAGYVMEDAYARDSAAWELAQSGQSLFSAFRGYSASDQYGGLLFASAAIYRILPIEDHQPLLMVVLTAAVSGLAVAFAWAFAHRLWGQKAASWAAWGLALYPDAALLGSSQMREAFEVTLAIWALYALCRWFADRHRRNALFLVLPVLLAAPLSYPFAVFLIGVLLIAYFALDEWRLLRRRTFWLPLLVGALLVLLVAVFFVDWSNLSLVQAGQFQAYVAKNASGWVARQFERVPLWAQFPFLILYGIFRPLLPAALVAGGAPIWQVIAIWRSLGWMVLLVLLLYASYLALRQRQVFKLPGVLLGANWLLVLVASYRGGGDDWDNPRYRSAFAAVQVALVAWALAAPRAKEDPWLKRGLVGAALVMLWFIPWYLRRYAAFDWPVVELYQVVGLGLASAALYALWDWVGRQ